MSANFSQDIWEIVATAILTTIGTFIITRYSLKSSAAKDADVRREELESESSYLAMRIAVILEEFTIKCINRNWHNETDLHEGRTELDYKLPTLTPYPQDSPDWKSFHDVSAKLAGRVLAFPNEITSAELASQYEATREGNRVASADRTVIAGLNAWKLAQALRENYGLDTVSIEYVDSLEQAADKIEQRRKDFLARIKRLKPKTSPPKNTVTPGI